MEFSDVIQKRYSSRKYRPDPVGEEKVQQVLEAVRLAPTAANRQPFKFIVIHTAGREIELRKIYNADWFVQARIIVCGWQSHQKRGFAGMARITPISTELGLGTCWIVAFDPVAARKVLGLPNDVEPILFTLRGYMDAQI